MNHRDVWFLGLLALAYLYLDAAVPAESRRLPARGRLHPLRRHPEARAVSFPMFTETCPRDLSHTVSLRSDGAKWCLGCDEAFYPALS